VILKIPTQKSKAFIHVWHYKILLSCFFLTSLCAREPEREKSEYSYQPIYAGTLLAFFANNVPPGKCLFDMISVLI